MAKRRKISGTLVVRHTNRKGRQSIRSGSNTRKLQHICKKLGLKFKVGDRNEKDSGL